MEEMINFLSCCRLCLTSSDNVTVDCLLIEELNTAIEKIFNFTILPEDKCSTKICKVCSYKITNISIYIDKVLGNQKTIEQYMKLHSKISEISSAVAIKKENESNNYDDDDIMFVGEVYDSLDKEGEKNSHNEERPHISKITQRATARKRTSKLQFSRSKQKKRIELKKVKVICERLTKDNIKDHCVQVKSGVSNILNTVVDQKCSSAVAGQTIRRRSRKSVQSNAATNNYKCCTRSKAIELVSPTEISMKPRSRKRHVAKVDNENKMNTSTKDNSLNSISRDIKKQSNLSSNVGFAESIKTAIDDKLNNIEVQKSLTKIHESVDKMNTEPIVADTHPIMKKPDNTNETSGLENNISNSPSDTGVSTTSNEEQPNCEQEPVVTKDVTAAPGKDAASIEHADTTSADPFSSVESNAEENSTPVENSSAVECSPTVDSTVADEKSSSIENETSMPIQNYNRFENITPDPIDNTDLMLKSLSIDKSNSTENFNVFPSETAVPFNNTISTENQFASDFGIQPEIFAQKQNPPLFDHPETCLGTDHAQNIAPVSSSGFITPSAMPVQAYETVSNVCHHPFCKALPHNGNSILPSLQDAFYKNVSQPTLNDLTNGVEYAPPATMPNSLSPLPSSNFPIPPRTNESNVQGGRSERNRSIRISLLRIKNEIQIKLSDSQNCEIQYNNLTHQEKLAVRNSLLQNDNKHKIINILKSCTPDTNTKSLFEGIGI